MIILCNMINGEESLSKFQKIYEKYKQTMYSVAYDISKNSHDAEDIVLDSLIKVIDILNDIDPNDIDKPRGKNLVITITKNTAIDYLRKSKKLPVLCDYFEEHQTEKTIEELYVEMEDYKRLVSYIDELDDKYKDVLRLRSLHHLSAKETGKVLNITEFNVNTRFMRAKALLAKKIQERGKYE